MYSLLNWFRTYIPQFAVFQLLFTVAMVIYLFNCDMDSSAKLTWMILITLLPIPGAIFLLYTRTDFGHRVLGARVADLNARTMDAITQDAQVLERLKGDPYATDDLNRYMRRSGCFPVYGHTRATYYPSGESMLDAILDAIDRATSFIFLEYFIIEEGEMWGRILQKLADKAALGVDVRVLYDGMCELTLLPHNYPERLKKRGIQAKVFAALTPFLSTYYNYRDHRKIFVVDGVTAFTGGVNLADEYINEKKPFGQWKDAGVKVEGDAAKSFTLMFLQMWQLLEKEPVFAPYLTEDRMAHAKPLPEDGFVIPYCDSPMDRDRVGENVYIDILYRATGYVYIMTPYLILDDELSRALNFAAERGVDVRIILPGVPDKKTAFALAKSHYRKLLQSGVRLYEYTPGFVHAKVFVSDDVRAVVGTINLDYRSLYHHFECAAYLYRTSCIDDISRDFRETLAVCREVTTESVRQEKLFYKALGHILKFIAPLM